MIGLRHATEECPLQSTMDSLVTADLSSWNLETYILLFSSLNFLSYCLFSRHLIAPASH